MDLDPHVVKVMTNEHLPQGETQVCPSCGYAFGGEMQGMAEPENEPDLADALDAFVQALRGKGY